MYLALQVTFNITKSHRSTELWANKRLFRLFLDCPTDRLRCRIFIPVSDFSFPGIGNGKMSFPGIPGIPGMQGVTQWVVSAFRFIVLTLWMRSMRSCSPFVELPVAFKMVEHSLHLAELPFFFLSENVPRYRPSYIWRIQPYSFAIYSHTILYKRYL